MISVHEMALSASKSLPVFQMKFALLGPWRLNKLVAQQIKLIRVIKYVIKVAQTRISKVKVQFKAIPSSLREIRRTWTIEAALRTKGIC